MRPARRPTSSTTAAGRRRCSRPATGRPATARTSPPSPTAGIGVGASTQFGGTGWDSIDAASQIVDDDVMVWSNRGSGRQRQRRRRRGRRRCLLGRRHHPEHDPRRPERLGDVGRHEPLGPVAAGATALVYQSYRQANVGAIPTVFYDTATVILKSSARRPRLRGDHPGRRLRRRRRPRWPPPPVRVRASSPERVACG